LTQSRRKQYPAVASLAQNLENALGGRDSERHRQAERVNNDVTLAALDVLAAVAAALAAKA
jgi:hypothetical protein